MFSTGIVTERQEGGKDGSRGRQDGGQGREQGGKHCPACCIDEGPQKWLDLSHPGGKCSKSASSLKSQAQLRDFVTLLGVFLTVAALGWLLASTVPADGPRVLPHSTSPLTNSFFQQTHVEHLLGARHCTRHQDIMVDQAHVGSAP